jgi:HK97 family phage prohead protease
MILGRTTNKSLRLYSDYLGLKFFNDMLPSEADSESTIARVARGDWNSCSFQFIVGKSRWEFAKRPGGLDLRILETISELLDISVVTFPAYKDTSIGVLIEQKRTSETVGDDIDGGIDYDADILWEKISREHTLKELQSRLKKYEKEIQLERRYKIAMGI